jgi:hypothetical protein
VVLTPAGAASDDALGVGALEPPPEHEKATAITAGKSREFFTLFNVMVPVLPKNKDKMKTAVAGPYRMPKKNQTTGLPSLTEISIIFNIFFGFWFDFW